MKPKAGILIDRFFTDRKVNMMYNTPYDPKDKKFEEFDCII